MRGAMVGAKITGFGLEASVSSVGPMTWEGAVDVRDGGGRAAAADAGRVVRAGRWLGG